VEVKGTTGDGEEIVLTSGELDFQRNHKSEMALFLVRGITLLQSPDGLVATGGSPFIIQPWDVDTGEMKAISFFYQVRDDQLKPCGSAGKMQKAGRVLSLQSRKC